MGKDAKAAVERTVFQKSLSSLIDIAVASAWVDEAWLKKSVEQVKHLRGDACAADGRRIQVAGLDVFDF